MIRPLELVISAIHCLKEKKGSSPQDIMRFLEGKYNFNPEQLKPHVQTGLKRGIAFGLLVQNSGLYRLNHVLDSPLKKSTELNARKSRKSPRRSKKHKSTKRQVKNKSKKRSYSRKDEKKSKSKRPRSRRRRPSSAGEDNRVRPSKKIRPKQKKQKRRKVKFTFLQPSVKDSRPAAISKNPQQILNAKESTAAVN